MTHKKSVVFSRVSQSVCLCVCVFSQSVCLCVCASVHEKITLKNYWPEINVTWCEYMLRCTLEV